MSTRASIHRHPIHPMLVVFPLGLWIFAFVCYVVYFANAGASWRIASLYAMAGGIIGAVLAAVPGLIDLLTLWKSRVWITGLSHMIANVTGLVLFIIAFVLGISRAAPSVATLVLSILGLIAISIGGWLGGAMVYVHGVGVARRQPQEAPELQEVQRVP
ncbi:MAG: DUF2231 domain-containing protein [Planctomycetes bacterium]|nr:DUF2231 domain-containing protein [Planctomycetota bacterium]